MSDKKYYDALIDDTKTYDKVVVDLEALIKNAPNARIRTVAELALYNINLSIEICKELKKHDNK